LALLNIENPEATKDWLIKAYQKDKYFYENCKIPSDFVFYQNNSIKQQCGEKIILIFYNSENYDQALKYCKEIGHREYVEKCFFHLTKNNPNDTKLLEEIGDYFYDEGEPEAAVVYYKKCKFLIKNPLKRELIDAKIQKIVKRVTKLETEFQILKALFAIYKTVLEI